VVIYGTSASGTTTYEVGGRNEDCTFAGKIIGVSGAQLALTKVGSARLTLTGANTYGGATIISNGVLALSGSGSINNSPTISLLTNTVLDTSGHSGGSVTLASGQTLKGSGTVEGSLTVGNGAVLTIGDDSGIPEAMTITNILTLQTTSTLNMDVDHYQYALGLTNDIIQGLAQVNYGGTLNLNIVSIETNSVFKLFNASTYSGAFASISPAAPPIGSPWIWDTNYLTVDGTLRVIKLPPSFSSITTSGSDITLNATGGTPNGSVTVLSSTDLTLPLASWTVETTGNFDGSGNYSYTVTGALNSGDPQKFYVLQVP
jgi:autotransporter-associated beta strand protein